MVSIKILLFIVCLLAVHAVRIENNGYKGITISFSEKAQLEGSYFNFEKLKRVLSNASEILFHATRKRSYFEEFVLVIPPTWANGSVCDGDVDEAPRSVDIYVTDIPSLTAQHSKGCGEEGDVIYMPINWLTGEVGDLAHQFVQRWSTYRYGVFSEDPETPGSCIATSDSSWSPTGCYNVHLETEATLDKNGLPVCYFPDDFKNEDLRSSIMFSSNSSKPLYFCDGSDSFPHNPVAPTLHNRICSASVWSIIKKTEDFIYARNLPVKDAKQPIFRCFKESKIHMTLAVQDSDTELRTEIRYAFSYFLSNLAVGDLDVSLVTFSNESLTDAMEPVNLDLQDGTKLKSHLLTELALNKEIPDICLLCGLRKAYEVSAANPNPLRVVVLFANASSLQDTDTSKLIELIRRNEGNAILHLIFLESEEDTIPSSLVDAMQNGRGRISRIKNESVFVFTQMSVALMEASKNTLHREDKILVVHQKTRVNVVSGFQDVFGTPKNVKGSLYYSMQCKERGKVSSDDSGCSVLDEKLQSPICESKVQLKDEDSPKTWKYSFEYIAGKEGTTCVSLALLKLDISSENVFTMNGWLNHDKKSLPMFSINPENFSIVDSCLNLFNGKKIAFLVSSEEHWRVVGFISDTFAENPLCYIMITPGYNALIIYAEVIGRKDEKVHVEALISGPGLTNHTLELRDNGNGDPDVIKGDHIYSRYFTSFSQKGTYTVSIYAASSVAKGSSKETNSTAAQTKVIGSFRVTNAPPKEDIIPPNRVSDLNAISINSANKTVLLQWTAPGDNYDDGRANKYIIKLSTHWMSLLDVTFDLKENIQTNADDYSPRSSGTVESLTIQCQVCSYNETYYLALKAIDDKENEGDISNKIQIYFNGKYTPLNDSVETSTDTSNRDSSQTSSLLVSTDAFTDRTSTSTTNTEENKTTVITSETTEGIFIEKKIITIAASTSGVILVLLIVFNVIACYCCFRRGKKSVKPKKLSRKASLRPPYNLNIAYRRGSQSSLEDNAPSNSTSTLVDNTTVYSSSDGRQMTRSNNYTYHTSQSLTNKMDSQRVKKDLGFQLVEPLPAYASSSLSRFATRNRGTDKDSPHSGSEGLQHTGVQNTEDTQVISLATEYKLYFTNDWRNLQEALMNKILPNILDTSEITPKPSGDKEKEIFNLPHSSLPILYYIALKALDKSENEGKLSNIIQIPFIVMDPICGNLTENITDDDIVTSSLEENVINKYIYAISGSALCLIILIVVINILIWILCFRKYKRNCSATVLNEGCHFNTKMQLTGDNINSDENILRSEYENSHIHKERQNEHLPHNLNAVNENNDNSNPLLLYAKVQKKSKNPDSPSFSSQNTDTSKKQHIQKSTHRENDLGFV